MVQDSITITVSDKATVDWIRSKVNDGRFSSETDLLENGIASMREEDAEMEKWMREVVASRYDAHKANPGNVISADQLEQNLAARRMKRLIHGL